MHHFHRTCRAQDELEDKPAHCGNASGYHANR
jgi:hypothetical protein